MSAAAAIKHLSDTWAALDAIRAEQQIEPFPKGGFTRFQYQQKYGLALSTAAQQLDRLVREGKLKLHFCMLPTTDGRMVKHRVYTVAK